jgi:hypothetical protein
MNGFGQIAFAGRVRSRIRFNRSPKSKLVSA